MQGKRGKPNRWKVPVDKHKEIHQGYGGGKYNDRFKEEMDIRLTDKGADLDAEDFFKIRDDIADEFDISKYRPGGL